MFKNTNRVAETFKNYASNIHIFSLTDNFEKWKKTASKAKFEAALQRCS